MLSAQEYDTYDGFDFGRDIHTWFKAKVESKNGKTEELNYFVTVEDISRSRFNTVYGYKPGREWRSVKYFIDTIIHRHPGTYGLHPTQFAVLEGELINPTVCQKKDAGGKMVRVKNPKPVKLSMKPLLKLAYQLMTDYRRSLIFVNRFEEAAFIASFRERLLKYNKKNFWRNLGRFDKLDAFWRFGTKEEKMTALASTDLDANNIKRYGNKSQLESKERGFLSNHLDAKALPKPAKYEERDLDEVFTVHPMSIDEYTAVITPPEDQTKSWEAPSKEVISRMKLYLAKDIYECRDEWLEEEWRKYLAVNDLKRRKHWEELDAAHKLQEFWLKHSAPYEKFALLMTEVKLDVGSAVQWMKKRRLEPEDIKFIESRMDVKKMPMPNDYVVWKYETEKVLKPVDFSKIDIKEYREKIEAYKREHNGELPPHTEDDYETREYMVMHNSMTLLFWFEDLVDDAFLERFHNEIFMTLG